MFKNRKNFASWMNRRAQLGMIHFNDGTGDGAGGGGSAPEITPEIQAIIDKAIAEATTGLSNKNKELLTTIQSQKATIGKFDGVNVEELLGLKEKIESDEILSLLAAGKTQEAFDRHDERQRLAHTTEITALKTQYEEFKNSVAAKDALIDRLLLSDRIGTEYLNSGGIPGARDDVIARARNVWKVEGDDIVARDAKGDLIAGAKGPITPAEWIQSLKTSASHLFPSSDGNLPNGRRSDGASDEQRLVEAAKQGAAALRAEKDRQAASKKR